MSQIKLKVIEADSEATRNPSFKQVDVDLFRSEAGVAKIHQQFERCAHPMNFTILMPDKHRITYGKALPEREMIVATHGHEILDPDMINVVYTNNVTNPRDHLPMNAWILAHRIGHVIQVSGIQGPNPWRGICDIMEDLTGENMFTEYLHRLPGSNDKIIALMPLLMTMRSARNVAMINELDVQSELIAQYLITGGVKFLPVEQWAERKAAVMAADPTKCFAGYTYTWNKQEGPQLSSIGREMFDKLDTMRSRFSDNEINEMLVAMANGVNDALRETFNIHVGKVLSF